MTVSRAPLFLAVSPRRPAPDALTATVKAMALEQRLGVAAVTTADDFPGLGDHLAAHIAAGHVAGMDWFTEERARFSAVPRNLHPTARSLLTVGIPYWSGHAEKPADIPRGRVSRYAWGNDYHAVLKRRMTALHARIEGHLGRAVDARLLVDTARIVDRAAAARAGLGWYGKHSCLIVPGHGSWVMLGTLVLDVELASDAPLDRDCGRCSFCLDRCPTGAIVAPYTVDAPRCLSFQTIEQRGSIPHEIRPLLGDWVFGCDVCQDVCPYTRAAAVTDDPDFRPGDPNRAFPSLEWLLTMDEAAFRGTFRSSAVLRAKRRGLARNAAVALGNQPSDQAVAILATALASHDEPLVRAHAAWSLGRIATPTARSALARAVTADPDSTVKSEIRLGLEASC